MRYFYVVILSLSPIGQSRISYVVETPKPINQKTLDGWANDFKNNADNQIKGDTVVMSFCEITKREYEKWAD